MKFQLTTTLTIEIADQATLDAAVVRIIANNGGVTDSETGQRDETAEMYFTGSLAASGAILSQQQLMTVRDLLPEGEITGWDTRAILVE